MATNTVKKRNIRYLNRDFSSFKKSFNEHLKVYFPDTHNDFNESSVGMMFTELAAYFGDNISFYLDKKFNESFTETAFETRNIFRHAKQLGFKAFGKTAAQGLIDCFLKVPVVLVNGSQRPDMTYAGTIKKGAKLKSKVGKTYETLEDVDFSKVNVNDSRFVQVGERDSQTNQPRNFVLKMSNISIKAGETTTTTFSAGDYKRFASFTLSDSDVLEILKIMDSEGNRWYEVDFLAQDTVFDANQNVGSDLTDVPYVLKLRSVPYRFITEYDISTNKTSIIFGSGDAQTFDGDLIPDLGELSLPTFGKETFTDFAIDPQNFLKTRTLGLAPVNTTLTVTYRVGGGIDTNAGTGEINTVADKTFEVSDSSLNATVVRDVGNSFSVINPNPVTGGAEPLDVEEIRQLIPTMFATQSRLVNAPDFIVRSLSLPAKYGSVFRANAKLNPLNKNSIELIILALDSNRICSHCTKSVETKFKNLSW